MIDPGHDRRSVARAPDLEVHVSAASDGVLADVPVHPGHLVDARDPLVLLDPEVSA